MVHGKYSVIGLTLGLGTSAEHEDLIPPDSAARGGFSGNMEDENFGIGPNLESFTKLSFLLRSELRREACL